jgi:hypothetical protein
MPSYKKVIEIGVSSKSKSSPFYVDAVKVITPRAPDSSEPFKDPVLEGAIEPSKKIPEIPGLDDYYEDTSDDPEYDKVALPTTPREPPSPLSMTEHTVIDDDSEPPSPKPKTTKVKV